MKLARRTCARFPGPLFRKTPDISEIGSGCPWKMQPLHISYGSLTQICPGYPGHNPEDAVASFFVGTNFPKYPEYFGNRFPEIFREMLSSKYPESFRKMVWSAIIEISGIFRKNGPGFERSRCVFQKNCRFSYWAHLIGIGPLWSVSLWFPHDHFSGK